MDRYLNVLNKLQDIFTECGVSLKEIELPQIAVVGCQSAGKSSVLESIAKQDLLPRGGGIVTRRPLVLQMINEPKPFTSNGKTYDTWAKFHHSKNDIFFSMQEVQQEIIDNTNLVCGADKGISDDPILLKLHSTRIPSLTLIDLPGLTKIAVGDQPKDIDRQIERLVRSYVSKESTIILAISPGNVDIANSDSLRLAQEIDPKGFRTLGVITKVDLMEDTKESFHLLQGKAVNLRLGLVGVINRSNKQIEGGVTPEEAIDLESEYLKEKYPSLSELMGTSYLSKKLCQLLLKKLKEALPVVHEKINRQLLEHQKTLENIGPEIKDKKLEVMNLVVKFSNNLGDSLNGRLTHKKEKNGKIAKNRKDTNKPKDEAEDFASAGSELKEVIEMKMQQIDLVNIEVSLDSIEKQIRASCGYQPSLFVADAVFSNIISEKIKTLKNPVMNVIDAAKKTLDRIVRDIAAMTFERFPALESEVIMISKQEIQAQTEKVKTFMTQYLDIQRDYVNTNNPEFEERYVIASELFKGSQEETYSDDDFDENEYVKIMKEKEVQLMARLVDKYFNITRKLIMDTLPKAIIRMMLHDFAEACKTTVLGKVIQMDANSLLYETQELDIKRKYAERMIDTLTKALIVMSEIGYSYQ